MERQFVSERSTERLRPEIWWLQINVTCTFSKRLYSAAAPCPHSSLEVPTCLAHSRLTVLECHMWRMQAYKCLLSVCASSSSLCHCWATFESQFALLIVIFFSLEVNLQRGSFANCKVQCVFCGPYTCTLSTEACWIRTSLHPPSPLKWGMTRVIYCSGLASKSGNVGK